MIETITFNNKEYYNAADVYKLEPYSFVGCSKTSRLIIIRKKLKEEDYVYARYDKLSNSWISSDAMYRLAKVLLTKTWVMSNLIKFKKNKSEEDYKIEDMIAPPIILLEDHEKFVNTDNNILEIEIRGEKFIDKIYFKVRDISEKFKLSNLNTTLTCSKSSFIRNIHFKSFKSYNNLKQGNPKHLFLTYRGLQKLIEISHIITIDNIKLIIHNWLNKLFNKIDSPYIIDINKNKKIANIGYVYCITTYLNNYVKIGYWKSSIDNLKARYITYYGDDIELYYVYTYNPYVLEQNCHKFFKCYCISNELFKKEFLSKYIEFININKINVDI